MLPDETLAQLARRIGSFEKDMVQIGQLPSKTCSRCGGTGSILNRSKMRFKPCKCTRLSNTKSSHGPEKP